MNALKSGKRKKTIPIVATVIAGVNFWAIPRVTLLLKTHFLLIGVGFCVAIPQPFYSGFAGFSLQPLLQLSALFQAD